MNRHRAHSDLRLIRVSLILAVVLTASLITPRAPQYDANTYWLGARDLVRLRSPYADGLLSLRGVWTSVLYVPAAALNRTGVPGPRCVQVENGILIALVGTVLIPLVVRHWRSVSAYVVVSSTILSTAVTLGFARYSLVDLWAAVLLLVALAALLTDRRAAALVGGLALGVTCNVRPAYLLTLIVVLLVLLALRRAQFLAAILGVVVSVVPQFILNGVRDGRWASVFPTDMHRLTYLSDLGSPFRSQ